MSPPSILERLGSETIYSGHEAPYLQNPDRILLTWQSIAFHYSGYARVARELLPAAEAEGLAVALEVHDIDQQFAREMRDSPRRLAQWNRMLVRRHHSGIHLRFHPPVTYDGRDIFALARGRRPGLDSYVGYTMFETDRLPRGWAEACDKLDRLFVPSQFCRDVFIAGGMSAEKVRRLPHGIDWQSFDGDHSTTSIKDRPSTVFLSVFEWSRRKGWDILLDAWREAFGPRDDVALVIKSHVGAGPSVTERIRSHWRERGVNPNDVARIEVVEEFLDERGMAALYRGADAFVLPSRGEGWGLPYLEAMGAGLCVIGTDWSGQRDFLDEETGLLIDVEALENVHPEQTAASAYYESDHRWAKPRLRTLVDHMRYVASQPTLARALGQRAKAIVRRDFSAEVPARILVSECAQLMEESRDIRRKNDKEGRGRSRIAWCGPLEDACGYAEEGRQYIAGLEEIGEGVKAFPLAIAHNEAALSSTEREQVERARRRVLSRRHVVIQHLLGHQARGETLRQKRVLRTMFECEGLPEDWRERINKFDEIWVPSAFNQRTFAEAGITVPLRVVPECLDAPVWRAEHEALPLPMNPSFKALAVLDWSLRKGWDVLLKAWSQAFKKGDDVGLFLKISSSTGLEVEDIASQIERYAETQLGVSVDDLAPISILDWRLDAEEMRRLYHSVDVLVQPSRGEGWGRPAMEALASGVPVIATGWGGSCAFLDASNSELIGYDLVPVSAAAAREASFFRGMRWAEPRVDDLIDALRRVHGDPDAALAKAACGREMVLRDLDRRTVARQMIGAVRELL